MLTEKVIREARASGGKRRRLFDRRGYGLFLDVMPGGKKVWRVRYRRGGRYRIVTLGYYPALGLAEARRQAIAVQQSAKFGATDPRAERQRQATFAEVAERWIREHLMKRAPSYRKVVLGRFRNDVFPYIGERPIRELSRQDVLDVARRAAERGAVETAHRLVLQIGQVFRYAEGLELVDRDPTRGLHKVLPPRTPNHMAAPRKPEEVASILRAFDAFRGGAVVKAALWLLPYTFARPGELRTMRWEDIDFERREWRYVVSKVGREHIVPLSRQALTILQELNPLTSRSRYVFPGRTFDRPISPAAINAAYRRLGIDTREELTAHGWRSVARTLLREELHYEREVIEHQLAHDVRGPLGEAYDRTEFLALRHKMMQDWADYLDALKAGTRERLGS